MTAGIGIVEQTVTAMPVVIPTGMIEDGIETDAVHGDVEVVRSNDFIADVIEPVGTFFPFGSCFGDKNGTAITVPDFLDNFVERTILGVVAREASRVMNPLITIVEINADNV